MRKIKRLALLLAASTVLTSCGSSGTAEKQQELKQQGMELQASGDYAGAIGKYNEALKLSDMKVGAAEADIACYKASAQFRSGDTSGAIDTYSALLAVREDETGYLGRGLLYISAGEAKKAEADLNKVLQKTEDPLIRGIIYDAVGQKDKAKSSFEEAKEKGDAEGSFYLACLYEEAGDHNYAMILLEEYIASGKAGAEGYLTVGRIYFEAGDYENALSMLQSGIALGESGVFKNLLQEEIACMERLGDFAGAKEKAENYLDRYPEDVIMQKEYEFLKTR